MALASLAVLAATALGHATLLKSEPADGQTLKRAPEAFVLTFDESIDAGFAQLRVDDPDGRRVHRGEPFHPDGREELVAVRLPRDIEGAYVATYRVISEDGHPVSRQAEFTVRPPMRDRDTDDAAHGMPAPGEGPAMTAPAGDHADATTGEVTETTFAFVRGGGYLAMALAIGAAGFLFVIWIPGITRQAGPGSDWRQVSDTFVARVRRIIFAAVVLGLATTAFAIVLQAATAAGVSLWSAFDRSVIDPVLETRPVRAWAIRFVVWLALGAVLLSALASARAPVLRRAALGAVGNVAAPALSRTHRLLLFAAVIALALTAPMAGHTGDHSPRGILICADATHLICMSLWLGGLALLLVVVPTATRGLSARERTPILAEVVGRFSRLAVVAVALIVLTGAIQSLALVGSLGAFVDTAYGRIVLAKIVLLAGLVALGAYNQRRSLPRLRRLAAGGHEPGKAAVLLRRAVAAEVALVIAVLGLTSVLVVTQPAVS
ncbi:MAG TPA: CopD family protein [Solirubrobacterales bacterium]|nr:CopD family protein [Solirubrobacterales bacterium]